MEDLRDIRENTYKGYRKLSPEEQLEEREFVKYILIFYGIGFVFLFTTALRIVLKIPILEVTILGSYSEVLSGKIYLVGMMVLFSMHAWSLSRLFIIYTKYDLDGHFFSFFRDNLPGITNVILAHVFCLIWPFSFLQSNLEKYGSFLENQTDFINYIVIDVIMSVAFVIILIVKKAFGLDSELLEMKETAPDAPE